MDYMKDQSEAQELAQEVSEYLDSKVDVTEKAAFKAGVSVPSGEYFIAIHIGEGQYGGALTYICLDNRKEWEAFKIFITRSAQMLLYGDIEKGIMAAEGEKKSEPDNSHGGFDASEG